MVEARWNGALIASSDDTIVVEGNHYFPANAVNARCSGRVTRRASARGRERRTITASTLTAPTTPMPLGIIPALNPKRRTSATVSLSGRALRSAD